MQDNAPALTAIYQRLFVALLIRIYNVDETDVFWRSTPDATIGHETLSVARSIKLEFTAVLAHNPNPNPNQKSLSIDAIRHLESKIEVSKPLFSSIKEILSNLRSSSYHRI